MRKFIVILALFPTLSFASGRYERFLERQADLLKKEKNLISLEVENYEITQSNCLHLVKNLENMRRNALMTARELGALEGIDKILKLEINSADICYK